MLFEIHSSEAHVTLTMHLKETRMHSTSYGVPTQKEKIKGVSLQ